MTRMTRNKLRTVCSNCYHCCWDQDVGDEYNTCEFWGIIKFLNEIRFYGVTPRMHKIGGEHLRVEVDDDFSCKYWRDYRS